MRTHATINYIISKLVIIKFSVVNGKRLLEKPNTNLKNLKKELTVQISEATKQNLLEKYLTEVNFDKTKA